MEHVPMVCYENLNLTTIHYAPAPIPAAVDWSGPTHRGQNCTL
jgi:hypothetical protein